MNSGASALSYLRTMYRVRTACDEDRAFVIEMARLACTLEDRPLPEADAAEVVACLPRSPAAAVIAIDHAGDRLGAAWWHLHEPSLLLMADGSPIPELTMAVAEDDRGQGIGAGLIEALANHAATDFSLLALNVHLRNPAARLYMRAGFRVAGKGQGWFGVAMTRQLRAEPLSHEARRASRRCPACRSVCETASSARDVAGGATRLLVDEERYEHRPPSARARRSTHARAAHDWYRQAVSALSWSGGKDSALSLHDLRERSGPAPRALITTVTADYERIPMHGVAEALRSKPRRRVASETTPKRACSLNY